MQTVVRPITAAFVFLLALFPSAAAQTFLETAYSPDIPTLEDAIGHQSGEAITSSAEILAYFEALEGAAPDRMQIVTYGESWQGRPLVYAVITSAENLARLDDIKRDLQRLGSVEEFGRREAQEIAARTPAVSWLSYGVHGDEISPSESALALAYHLLAASEDPLVDAILSNTITIIDPNQNPDGRERFVHSFESALGLEPLADRYTAEHDQPWPRGRFNHYLFDLNRDWFSMTQPETRAKVAAVLEWHPVVFVDSHEMGGDSTYYFPPAAAPYNPNLTEAQKEKQSLFGINHAAWFDRLGIPYFTREIFDNFYPGYGDMWPQFNGAVAKTFEQASARGLRFTRRDGSELTLREGVRNNFIASLSTAQVVAENKEQFLVDYAAYRRDAVEDGISSRRRYFLIDLAERRWQAEKLGRRLEAQGIEVARLAGSRTLCGDVYSDGVLVVDRAQPNGRLISTLLDRNTELPAAFIADQERRRARGLNHELYDVTAWSLPLMDGLNVKTCRRVGLSRAESLEHDTPVAPIAPQGGAFAIAVPWTDTGQAQLVIAALRAGLTGRTTEEAFIQNGRTFGAGTAVFPAKGNPSDMVTTFTNLAAQIGAEFIPMETSWVDVGPNFGSNAFAELKAPRVALAWGQGTKPTSAGATRFIIERQLGLPVSPIRLGTLPSASLSEYDVIVLPDGDTGFGDALGGRGLSALDAFVQEGGTLIAIGSSLNALAGENGLVATQREDAFADSQNDGAGETDSEGSTSGTRLEDEAAYDALIEAKGASPDQVPGALVRVEANPDHWLAAGYSEATALVTGSAIYRPLNAADGVNVFRFSDAETLVASGYLWEESRLQLAFKPFVMIQPSGDGQVIAFTQSPTTRAYLNGLTLLLANATVLAPARNQ
ncbi:MAG: M14 family metallopeptidase [Pseudomonadota bacterium]